MQQRVTLLSFLACLALVGAACGGGDSSSDTAAPAFVEQGGQAIDTSEFVTTTTTSAGGSGGASESDGEDAGEAEPTDAEGAGGTTLPQNELSQDEAVDDMFTAMRTFNSCLEDEGQPFIGFDANAPASDPRQSPAYLEALGKCAAVSQIQDAVAAIDLGSEGKTPEEIEQQNRGLVGFVDCLKGRGWDPAPLEADENGGLLVGDLGAPEGESILDSDDLDDCRRLGQESAAEEAAG